jgi:choline kinase
MGTTSADAVGTGQRADRALPWHAVAVRTAVILAAGMGTRLAGVLDDRPKALLEVGGRPLLEWSLRALRSRGVERCLVVAGYRAEQVRAFVAGWPWVEVIVNRRFATTGTLESAALGLRAVEGDVLLLEGDLLYEPGALDAVLNHPALDVLLASGPTGAGDEVWVGAPGGQLVALSKERHAAGSVDGELVGIVRLSDEGRRALLAAWQALAHRPGRPTYDVDGLSAVTRRRPIAVLVQAGLIWGEIDDEAHRRRVVERVWPAVAPAYARLCGP